jgi:hypothetical protein
MSRNTCDREAFSAKKLSNLVGHFRHEGFLNIKDRLPKLKAGRLVRPAWALGGRRRAGLLTTSPPGNFMVLLLIGGWLRVGQSGKRTEVISLGGRGGPV